MSLVPRNAPCPCGSGLKYKRCCLDRERELVRKADVLEELLGLATMFPLLRPDSRELDALLDARPDPEVTKGLIEEALALLSEEERVRIATAHAREFPSVWRSLVDDYGDEVEAEQAVLVGAIVAALGESATIDSLTAELLERDADLAADPTEAIALALDGTGLYSIAEATALDEALAQLPEGLDDDAYGILWTAAVGAEAARIWSPQLERRLRRLVRRLHMKLPIADRPQASAVLADACSAFERDETVVKKVAEHLLAASLGSLRQAELAAALAA